MIRNCRIWWPKQLSSAESSSSSFLFGWFFSCSSTYIDVVVASACNEVYFNRCQSHLQEIIYDTNGNMPIGLQNKSTFSLLGQCTSNLNINGKIFKAGTEKNYWRKSTTVGFASETNTKNNLNENCGGKYCGCHEIDGFVQQFCQASVESGHWIQLMYGSCEQYGSDIYWIPRLHHIHWNGQIISQCDVHVIVYENPLYGTHHFSMNSWLSSEQDKVLKKPKWVDELHKKESPFDLDIVILAINSSTASSFFIERLMGNERSYVGLFIIHMCHTFICQLLAIFVASASTLFYVIIQVFHVFLSFGSETWIYVTSGKLFRTTWRNVHIRCCQILYWPIFLQDNGLRSRSCVEYVEKAALHRHSMWSSLAVDLLLGNLIGLVLLFHAESACLLVVSFAKDITNELLRSGCVWLMGVPAGFKLNTELAGVLGMVSLNAIQIWSTLWVFAGSLFNYFIKLLALLGIVFGATVPAALAIDMTGIAAFHVLTLHRAISLLYSLQIQALAALWRLFRGRKWNPLRQRLDSYDYTVKQHIVGSLLFTPLLLLLPTTCVFYIFFAMLNTSITLFCTLIEVIICIIHCTPYMKVLLWLVGRRRFPSGIWFDIASCQSDSHEFKCLDKVSMSCGNSEENDNGMRRFSILVSILHSNFSSIGELVLPHYKNVFSGFSGFITASAYGALTGKRTASSFEAGIPSTLPWMFIPVKKYWHLCYCSILACMTEHECGACKEF